MKIPGASVLVTGAGGTVGSVAVERLLREGAHVRALVRGPLTTLPAGAEPVVGDLLDQAALQRALDGVQLVVHCAAWLGSELEPCLRVNREGTRTLLRAMEERGCRALVHLSSASVYDHRAGLELDEESAVWTEPLDAYGFSKAEAERLVLAACSRGLEATILRPVLVLSTHPRSYWGALALERARSSTDPVFPVANVPYVHVDNLVEAIVLATRGPMRGRIYDVIDAVGDAQEYLDAVGQALGREPATVPPGAPRLRYAGARIRDELGYAPVARWEEFLTALSHQGAR